MEDGIQGLLGGLFKRQGLTIFVAGAAFFAVAVMGGVPLTGIHDIEEAWRIAAAVAGISFMTVGVYAVLQDRIGADAPPATGDPVKLLDVSAFEIAITSPAANLTMPVPFELAGRAKPPPEGYQLWVFTTNDDETKYWPHREIKVRANNTWRTEIHASKWKTGDRRRMQLFLVGKDGQALVDYFVAAGSRMPRGERRTELTDLTRDTIKCGDPHDIFLAGSPAQKPGAA